LAALLRKAATLLVDCDDSSWDDLLPIAVHLERHDMRRWEDLAVAILETMAVGNVCEALGRDPWSAAAPLMTRLLRRLARHAPAHPHRAVQAICALFDHLQAAEPLTLPDGLPGATAALAAALPGHRPLLTAAFSRMVNGQRLDELMRCGRTTQRELQSLRAVAGDAALEDAIDRVLRRAAGHVASATDHR